jgi:hypothetical protein
LVREQLQLLLVWQKVHEGYEFAGAVLSWVAQEVKVVTPLQSAQHSPEVEAGRPQVVPQPLVYQE